MTDVVERARAAVQRLEGARAHAWLTEALQGSFLAWRQGLVDAEPPARAIILFGVSTWTGRPVELSPEDELPPLEDTVSIELLARWAERSFDEGNTDSVLRALRRHRDAATLLPVVVRGLLAKGLVANARAEIEATHWMAKGVRAQAVLEVVRAGIATIDDVLAVVTGAPFVQTGHARGGDELDALVDVLACGGTWLPQEAVWALVEAAIGLGARGQRTTRPTGFANLLARGCRVCAEQAGAGTAHLVEATEQLSAAIAFEDIRATVAPTLDEARARLVAGTASSFVAIEPSWPETPAEPTSPWKHHDEPRRRIREANRAMVRALDMDDADAFFEALAIAIAPVGPTLADRLRAWQTAEPSSRGARLLDILRHDDLVVEGWCVQGTHEPWEALGNLEDHELATAVLELAFERDFVTRAYPFKGDWRRPRSIAAQLMLLASRHAIDGFVPRLLAAASDSTRPGVFHRLFDALAIVAPTPVHIDLEMRSALPAWLGWALVSRVAGNRDELRARYGEPPPELLYRVCEEVARVGRVDDALELASHPSSFHTFASGYEQRRPPPTQDALLTIARTATLTDKQRKRVLAAFKKAPRQRSDGHKARLAELQTLLEA
ncbi:MAG: hypothetical protein R3B40_30115 [Polyangiales bacterium]|nr:hypothetical protein [Myxococcales bacterium]MCB9662408.1 hypothetical protein [Sandaracinaceae bacterium]